VADALQASQRAYYVLDFDRAEALAEAAIKQAPAHPLPRLFLQGALMARLQEDDAADVDDPAALARFESATAGVLDCVARRRDGSTAWDLLYQGGALGARGLVRLYGGHYLDAYSDGRDANEALKKAVALDPGLEAAWLGLGQYEYYCGSLSGLLRFVLDLHGDMDAGIDLLKRCGAGRSFAALPARLTLARILATEQVRPAEALPYVEEARRAFPENYSYFSYALACVRGLGPQDPAGQRLRAALEAQWALGWRPPAYAAAGIQKDWERLGR
jgi:tetratricopeptide (TPR) repeat protein